MKINNIELLKRQLENIRLAHDIREIKFSIVERNTDVRIETRYIYDGDLKTLETVRYGQLGNQWIGGMDDNYEVWDERVPFDLEKYKALLQRK